MVLMSPRLTSLLRGDADEMLAFLDDAGPRGTILCALTILLGSGLYGATVGLWRAPLQALFTAAKFPLLIFLTGAGNAVLNGLLAQLLGSGLSFRQTSRAILLSFALTSLILGGLSPISLFVLWNTPPLAAGATTLGHSVTLLTHVGSDRRRGRARKPAAAPFADPRERQPNDCDESAPRAGWAEISSSAVSSPGFSGRSSGARSSEWNFFGPIRCAGTSTKPSGTRSAISFSEKNQTT